MKSWTGILAVLTAGLTAAYAAEPVAESGQAGAWRGFEIGTRLLHVELQDDERGVGTDTRDDNFLGTIDQLDLDDDLAPTRIYAQYFFSENIGVGVSYDAIEADATDEEASDGLIQASGPILYLVGRYPNGSAFTPFAEVGVGFYSTSFDEEESWADDGEFRRYMKTDDAEAFVLALGCDYNINEAWSVNLYARVVEGLDFDAAHYNTENPSRPRQTGEFTLDYFGVGLGVKYAFQ